MTEEEAKTKWCPFTGRMIAKNEPLHPTDNDNPRCIGSACMAGRWNTGDPYANESKGGILLPRELWPGHCGLVGKP